MSDLKRKLSSLKNLFKKNAPPYKRLHNYDPDNPFPEPEQSYKKFPSPKPPKSKKQSGGRRQKGGKRRKQKGGRRRKQKGGRRKQRGGRRKRT